MLDKSLAFPLLRELRNAGDPKTQSSLYKEKIAERFEKGTDATRMYLINQNYLKDFLKEEFESLFRSVGNLYKDEIFWKKMTVKELFESFEKSSNKSATFVLCETHSYIANVYGKIS